MGNPFYLQEIPVDAPFCDREKELKELRSYAEAKANVVLFSPRRFGKTSLVKRVQRRLADKGAVVIFADFFGVGSVEDVAARLAKAVYGFTHGKPSLWKTALRTLLSFRPVLKPDPSGGISLSVEPAAAGRSGLHLLEETIDSLSRFIEESKQLIQIALDEFQEIVTLKEALTIEAALRTRIQRQKASYFFIGSRRRVLLGIFNERQRPFFQSAINYPLGPLPVMDLGNFITWQFKEHGKSCTKDMGLRLASTVDCHPYYSEKLGFFVYEMAEAVNEETIQAGLQKLIVSEKPVFEAILQGLSPHQRLLLKALALEPPKKILAGSYVQKHGLGSTGGVQHSTKHLEDLDLIERKGDPEQWQLVDPVLAMWLKATG
ncbi:MAG: AAA family ATPase [Deltaproteobacteria bacterium]|nr:AAA family ATPase [Deltaproteobacteria bacterium]